MRASSVVDHFVGVMDAHRPFLPDPDAACRVNADKLSSLENSRALVRPLDSKSMRLAMYLYTVL